MNLQCIDLRQQAHYRIGKGPLRPVPHVLPKGVGFEELAAEIGFTDQLHFGPFQAAES